MPVEVRGADRPGDMPPVVERTAAAAPRVAAAPRGSGRVLVATFVTLGLAYGFWYSYAVFLVAFLREFG